MKPHEIKNLAKRTMSEKPSAEIDDTEPPKGQVEHMSIQPDHLNGQDGFMAEHRYKQKPTKSNEPMPMPDSEKHFFPKGDAEGLGEHVKKTFGGKP